MSEKELAEYVEISPAYVSAIERGVFCPGSKLLDKLSKTLECQIPAELVPQPRKSIRLSRQNLEDLLDIKEALNIQNDSEVIGKAFELLREQLEKST